MEKEILSVAKQLSEQGKKPTVALVKAKLSQRVPMPLLLQTLQRFQTLSVDDLNRIEQQPTAERNSPDTLAQQVATLTNELNQVKNQLSELKQQISTLMQPTDISK